MPICVVEFVAQHDAVVLGDEVALQVELAVLHPEKKVGPAPPDGDQTVGQGRPEPEVEFVTFLLQRGNLDVGVAVGEWITYWIHNLRTRV